MKNEYAATIYILTQLYLMYDTIGATHRGIGYIKRIYIILDLLNCFTVR